MPLILSKRAPFETPPAAAPQGEGERPHGEPVEPRKTHRADLTGTRWRRSLLLGAAALALAGCGFHPLYAHHRGSGFDADLATIHVNTIKDRQGQLLAIALRDGLNPTGARADTRYMLDVQLNSLRVDIGLRPDGTASRSQITMTAKFALKDAKGEKTMLEGTTHSVSSFDVLTDDYTTVVAQHTAEERTLRDIGDDILTRLQLYVSKHRTAPTAS
jgi:LPS-assembly lipoprotein